MAQHRNAKRSPECGCGGLEITNVNKLSFLN